MCLALAQKDRVAKYEDETMIHAKRVTYKITRRKNKTKNDSISTLFLDDRFYQFS